MGCNVRSQIADAFSVPSQPFAMAQGRSDRDGAPQGGGNDHRTAPHDTDPETLTGPCRKIQMPRTSSRSRPLEALPYRIELWDAASDERRVLARAVNAQLGRAIFRAASGEYPESRIPLRRGNRFVADSAALKRSAARADS